MGAWIAPGPSRIGVFRRADGAWFLDINGSNAFEACNSTQDYCVAYGGGGGFVPQPGDWTGDGKTKLGVYYPGSIGDPNSGAWYWDTNSTFAFEGCGPTLDACFIYGYPGDKAIVGDWNGDGRAKVGVVRNGTT